MRPVCVKCGREMNCEKNGVVVYHPYEQPDPGPIQEKLKKNLTIIHTDRMMDIDPNYCLRHKSTTGIILEYAWIPITAATLTVATIFAGPLGFYGVWAVTSTGGLIASGTALAADWKMSWPTRELF